MAVARADLELAFRGSELEARSLLAVSGEDKRVSLRKLIREIIRDSGLEN